MGFVVVVKRVSYRSLVSSLGQDGLVVGHSCCKVYRVYILVHTITGGLS